MNPYFLFTAGLLVLFLLSRMITRKLSQVIYHQTRSETITIYAVAVVFFPGVFIHELSHFLAAVCLGVRASDIEFFPKMVHDRLKLGSVLIQKTDPFRKTLIAVAPVFGGIVSMLTSIWLVRTYFATSTIALILLCFFIYQVSNTMFSSKKDLEGTGIFVIVIGLIALVLWLLQVPVVEFLTQSEPGILLQQLLSRGVWYLGVAVGIDIAAVLMLQGISFLQRR